MEITLSINSQKIIDFYNSGGNLNNLLKLGLWVQMNSEINISDSLNSTEGALYKNISTLTETIQELRGGSKVSAIKGAITENLVKSNLEAIFKECQIIDTSSTNYNFDLKFSCRDYPDIAIELKNYKSNITSDQINKFKRDLNNSEVKFAIFASTHSGIYTKPPFTLEKYGKCQILYIPHSGTDGQSIAWAIRLFKILGAVGTKETGEAEGGTGEAEGTKETDKLKRLDTLSVIYKALIKSKEGIERFKTKLNRVLDSETETMRQDHYSIQKELEELIQEMERNN